MQYTAKTTSLRLPESAFRILDDLAGRIEARQPAQGRPTRTQILLMGLDALARELEGAA